MGPSFMDGLFQSKDHENGRYLGVAPRLGKPSYLPILPNMCSPCCDLHGFRGLADVPWFEDVAATFCNNCWKRLGNDCDATLRT